MTAVTSVASTARHYAMPIYSRLARAYQALNATTARSGPERVLKRAGELEFAHLRAHRGLLIQQTCELNDCSSQRRVGLAGHEWGTRIERRDRGAVVVHDLLRDRLPQHALDRFRGDSGKGVGAVQDEHQALFRNAELSQGLEHKTHVLERGKVRGHHEDEAVRGSNDVEHVVVEPLVHVDHD